MRAGRLREFHSIEYFSKNKDNGNYDYERQFPYLPFLLWKRNIRPMAEVSIAV
jgi:hypothetical protein